MSKIEEFEDLNRTDELDRAAGLTMRLHAEAEQAVRARAAPEKFPDGKGGFITQGPRPGANPEDPFSYKIRDCVSCGDELVIGRLKLGRIRCVDCQERKENPRKR
jgi:hypothetical protein